MLYAPPAKTQLSKFNQTQPINKVQMGSTGFKNKFEDAKSQQSTNSIQTRNAVLPMMAQVPSSLDCSYSLHDTVTSAGRAALNHLLSLDCSRHVNARTVTEQADANYN